MELGNIVKTSPCLGVFELDSGWSVHLIKPRISQKAPDCVKTKSNFKLWEATSDLV